MKLNFFFDNLWNEFIKSYNKYRNCRNSYYFKYDFESFCSGLTHHYKHKKFGGKNLEIDEYINIANICIREFLYLYCQKIDKIDFKDLFDNNIRNNRGGRFSHWAITYSIISEIRDNNTHYIKKDENGHYIKLIISINKPFKGRNNKPLKLIIKLYCNRSIYLITFYEKSF